MKVQRITDPQTHRVSWMVLDNHQIPIEAIENFIGYMESTERSPNTIKNYCYHLKLYWEYLESAGLNWTKINIGDLQKFVHWLSRKNPKVLTTQPELRSKRTINVIISAIYTFYEYQHCLGIVGELPIYQYINQPRKYQGFLYGIGKTKPTKVKRFKLKLSHQPAKIINQEQVMQLLNACKLLRDKFLISLLDQTGMRIGQALGLRHEDITTWAKEIRVVPRTDNTNGARAKTDEINKLTVDNRLMGLYAEYLTYELSGIDSDYVFVNIVKGEVGKPMNYSSVISLFRRLSKKVGFDVTPHIFRHTHASELLRADIGMQYVQKRLGHKSIQTTINIYGHLTDSDMKKKIENFNQRFEV